MFLGIDIGSISINAVLMTAGAHIREEHYVRTHGQPVETLLALLRDMCARHETGAIQAVAVTGSGGPLIAEALGCHCVNEIIAQSTATARLCPEIRTIIEIGGEDAKLIQLEPDPVTGTSRIKDFAMNTVCAAGTGSFLDQQAARLGVSIEEEFGRLALKSQHPPRIAGRCSVFAKSDMIHLQQIATPDHDIIMGLCMAMARNFKSNEAKGIELQKPIAFQGGVAANRGMVRAFESVLELQPGELVIPGHFCSMGAIGAVISMLEAGAAAAFSGTEPLETYLHNRSFDCGRHPPLEDDGYPITIDPAPVRGSGPVGAFLGIDVGSISTNLVVIDESRRVIARRYLMTGGRPIEAVCRGLREIGSEVGGSVIINGAATTGSGRYLIGDFVGADCVKNEITAHARGAIAVNPQVDTIFEIGGQDSKYISLDHGAVVDFTMNKVCAAGTGSFLEEQAEKLGLDIKSDFSALALSSAAPVNLGERCTVFMESSLNHYQQQGLQKQDLVAGLCYSIVLNYLNRVVEERRIGDVIFFQGGTAYNRGVKAAFEKICGKKITVPEHHDVLGALGAALIALEHSPDGPSLFKGFDLAQRQYTVESFECHDCPNTCEIRKVSIEGEPPLYYGSRCGKYDEKKREAACTDGPDLFAERSSLLNNPYTPSAPVPPDARTVGIPRATLFFELYPFWYAFFSELGFRVVSSPKTTRRIVNRGCEAVMEEICFPIKVAHGHVSELIDRDVDFLFLPCIVNMEHLSTDARVSYNCPFVQSLPYLVGAALKKGPSSCRILSPVLHFEWGARIYTPQLHRLGKMIGRGKKAVNRATEAAFCSLRSFRTALSSRGREVLGQLPGDRPCIAVVSRPYNGCDPGLNFDIPGKLRALGAFPIPLDYLPAHSDFGSEMSSMYWRYGQRILSAARTVSRDPRLHAVYITNFSCGPDSFITKYFDREMAGKPYLSIELDEHSADAGIITRLEAYLDSLRPAAAPGAVRRKSTAAPRARNNTNHRKVYIPYMDDHGLMLAAAMRHRGIDAEALPMADESSIALGRRYTTGKECYPCIITTGDIVRKAMADDFSPERSCFFMPSAMGPCRFGQYNRFHRHVLNELGLGSVELLVLDQTTDYDSTLSALGPGFRLLGWQGLIVIDFLKKLQLHTRPYELNPGETDAVYAQCLDALVSCVEQSGTIGSCAQDAARRFKAIPADRSRQKPLIGIVGEIFVRSNRFSNDFIIERIEQCGGEVVMPTLQEWVSYTDWERRKDFRREGPLSRFLLELFKGGIQSREVKKIKKAFTGTIPHFFSEPATAEVMRLCGPYLPEDIRGEATLSMGRCVEYAQHGCHGIVNVIPFNCMPGTIVNTLLCRFARDYPHLPILKMVYDGTRQSGDHTRIEAFMHQASHARDRTAASSRACP